MRSLKNHRQAGFTLIELLVSMTVFSLMLLIIVASILNILRVRNETLASNATQDSARAAMNELVRAVRDSASIESVTPGPNGTLCMVKSGGSIAFYHVVAGVLRREDDCSGGVGPNSQPLTNTTVQVSSFDPVREVTGPTITKEEIKLSLTIASANGTTTGSGATITCNTTYTDRQFCSSITLTSGAVAR